MHVPNDYFARKFAANSKIAVENRRLLKHSATTAISVVGSAGSGKTALIESAAHRAHHTSVGAIIGNLASSRDAERLQRLGIQAVPVITDNLTAEHVRDALTEFDLDRCDILFIESNGNADSPVEYDFGQSARVAVFSVAGGDDKAAEFPRLVADADLIVLTKSDLLPHVHFDLAAFHTDIATLNPEASIITTSHSKHGFDEWITWLSNRWTSDPTSDGQVKHLSACFVHAPSHARPVPRDIFSIEGER